MPATANDSTRPANDRASTPERLKPNPFSLSIYGDPSAEIDDLMPSIREHGILVPLVVAPGPKPGTWEVISGHRRLACALALGLAEVPCEVRRLPRGAARQTRDPGIQPPAPQDVQPADARGRRARGALGIRGERPAAGQPAEGPPDRRIRPTTPSVGIPTLGPMRGFRPDTGERRAMHRVTAGAGPMRRSPGTSAWEARISTARPAPSGGWPARATPGRRAASPSSTPGPRRSTRLTRTYAAATASAPTFARRPTTSGRSGTTGPSASPTPAPSRRPSSRMPSTTTRTPAPWSSTRWPAAGPRSTSASRWDADAWLTTSIPPARRSTPTTSATGFPPEAAGCDLIFCDPPYHTMLARHYACDSIATAPLSDWIAFLHDLARHAFATLRPGGCLALLLAAQTEKDLPAGFGYLDHAFFGYAAARRAGFLPERRISCPMDGAYLPQHVRRARDEGRLLGQVRDLLVMRKPSREQDDNPGPSRPYAGLGSRSILCKRENGRSEMFRTPAILASAILASHRMRVS